VAFRIQQVSNFGTSIPAVARTIVQGSEIVKFFGAPDEQKDKANKTLWELKRHAVKCVEIADGIKKEVAAGREQGIVFQGDGRAFTLPSVPDLQSRAESFLQSAKLAIAETGKLVEVFYGGTFGHRYDKLAAWAEAQFGVDDEFTHTVRGLEPWVNAVVEMRNAVDHPKDVPGGRLITNNFDVIQGPREATLVDPTWNLFDQPRREMMPELEAVIDGIIEVGEEILAELFYKLQRGVVPLVIYEIPAAERNPACPIRIRVTLAIPPGDPTGPPSR